MTFFRTTFLMLLGSLCVQASARQEPLFRLHSLTRFDFRNVFQLHVAYIYEGSEPLHVEWVGPGDRQFFRGITTLEVDKSELGPADLKNNAWHLYLGNSKTQYFDITWDLSGTGDRSVLVDMVPSRVDPGTDQVYVPGTEVTFTVAVEHMRGKGHLKIKDPKLDFHATFMLGDKAVSYSSDRVPFYKVSFRDSGTGVTLTEAKFKETDDRLINGWFSGSVSYDPTDPHNSPVKEVSEAIKLTVHDGSHRGPFPEGFIKVQFLLKQETHTCSRSWPICSLSCAALGNDVQVVQIYKANGQPGQSGALTERELGYERQASLYVDVNSPDTAGDYVCKGITKGGNSAEKRVTVLLED